MWIAGENNQGAPGIDNLLLMETDVHPEMGWIFPEIYSHFVKNGHEFLTLDNVQ